MQWTPLDTDILLAGILSAVACAIPGSFLVLKRMSLMGDAISHAVLPGLAIAFLATGSRDSVTMFAGAAVAGLLTAVLTQWVHRAGRVEEGASMGVVFTLLFALGLVLIVRAADHVELDPSCVLYGAIELTPLDRVTFLGFDMPRAVRDLSVVCGLNLLVVVTLFKELKIATFDPDLATTLGIHAGFMHYLLMALVAVTTVACFESVGSILVVAMLIVPPAAAYLLTDRLGPLLVLSILLATLSATLGHVSAITLPALAGYASTNTSGMIALAAGLLLVGSLLLGPRYGLASRALHRARLRMDVLCEDMLGLLWRVEERAGNPSLENLFTLMAGAIEAGGVSRRIAVRKLVRNGFVRCEDGNLYLTRQGRQKARTVIRSHRLWERFLETQLRRPAERAHESAMQFEHVTDERMREALEETLSPGAGGSYDVAIPDEPSSSEERHETD